jgi:hypothetical protein
MGEIYATLGNHLREQHDRILVHARPAKEDGSLCSCCFHGAAFTEGRREWERTEATLLLFKGTSGRRQPLKEGGEDRTVRWVTSSLHQITASPHD